MVRIAPVLVVLLGLTASIPATAQELYRCKTAAGERIYSDKPCERFSAEARDAPEAPALPPVNTVQRGELPDAAVKPNVVLENPIAADGCMGPDADALRRSVLDATLHGDLNVLAGLWDWPGSSQPARVFARFQQLIAATPVVARLEPVDFGAPSLVLYADHDAFEEIARFRLVRRAGCLWLSGG